MLLRDLFLRKRGVNSDSLFLQCFPEGTDMTSILDFYFQVNAAPTLFLLCQTFR